LKILVTGADGFTGRHFTKAAEAEKHQVVPLRADLRDEPALMREVAEVSPEWVVHLAGIAFVGHDDDAELYAVNTVGTERLLSALAALPKRPSKVLLASSANVYGNCKHSPITESAPFAPANHYAASKMAMEAMARNYEDKLPLVIARPFNYTGVGQSLSFVIPKLVDHFARKATVVELGNIDVQREYNDVSWVCDAYLRLLLAGEPGEAYNVCTGVTHGLREVLAVLQQITGHAIEVQLNPAFVRASEVHKLCGDPAKLSRIAGESLSAPQASNLNATLQRMLTQ
jgi:nucleoside-diphosphate-sugar epimerase